ncbi:MAG: hypothetical protein K2V38_24180, partial [Gemmataceae bacterium]|nr:hypothetical protein [Gemmataceae bacterium]
MPVTLEPARDVHARVLAHLLARIAATAVCDEPFTHAYFEELLPADVFAALLAHLPPADRYGIGPRDAYGNTSARTFYNLTAEGVRGFPAGCREVWRGVAAALTDPELKRALYGKLAPDLIRRFGVGEADVPELAGHPRPTLYRDAEGFEIPPHPDTLKKVVTMHLFLPPDLSQLGLGTALYRRIAGPVARGDWSGFERVKQFAFRPNSGYAFVVSDGPSRQSWHGRERLP